MNVYPLCLVFIASFSSSLYKSSLIAMLVVYLLCTLHTDSEHYGFKFNIIAKHYGFNLSRFSIGSTKAGDEC